MAKTNKEICTICCEVINNTNRKNIKCLYCNYYSCRLCIKQYLLTNINDPNCMNCKKVWNREFLCNNFPKIFINNDYKNYQQNLLLDKEKALLPMTQPIVEAINNKQKLKKILYEYDRKVNIKRIEILDEINYNDNIITGKTTNLQKRTFIRKCGVEGCRGFLSQQWKCGICDTNTCNKCLEILINNNDEHVCKEDNIESAKLIAKDSKPCPKCASLIFKIDGCFAKDTPILQWNGNCKMSQNIQIGDILVGDDKKPRKVLQLCSGFDDLYQITQSKGTKYIVNSKHKLVLKFNKHKQILWKEYEKCWYMHWFDHSDYTVKNKIIDVTETKTKEITLKELKDFRDTIIFPDIIEIRVDDFIKILTSYKKYFMGFKSNTLKPYTITVKYIGKGQYYGWSVDNNKRFVLSDFTVVRNCDQMFCTSCNTAFSWRTGQIETSRIHNPHYYEMLRKLNKNGEIPREPGDNQCQNINGMPDIYQIQGILRKKFTTHNDIKNITVFYKNKDVDKILKLSQQIYHILQFYTDTFQAKYEEEKRKLRIDYLMNNITEDNWKKELQKKDKKYQKTFNDYQVMRTLDILSGDIIRSIEEKDFNTIYNDFEILRNNINDGLYQIAKQYYNTFKFIDKNWTLQTSHITKENLR